MEKIKNHLSSIAIKTGTVFTTLMAMIGVLILGATPALADNVVDIKTLENVTSDNSGLNSILSNVGTLAVIIVGIIGVVVILKGVFNLITKGDGSKGKIITEVLILVGIIILILMFTNISAFAGLFTNVGDSAANIASNTADQLLKVN